MRHVCVFCGSSQGSREDYALAARALGQALLRRGLGLVYGGGSVGLMGIVAETVMAGGGHVLGIIPEALTRMEVGNPRLSELRVVATMHERKAQMAEAADAFIALPGGIGTLEEMFEIWTWGQLGLHTKPLGILDVAGYYSHLITFLDHAQAEGFLRPRHGAMVSRDSDPDTLLDALAAYTPPDVVRVIGRDTA